jgi:uncharacterized membrane protein YvbJ
MNYKRKVIIMYCPRCRIETDTDTFCESCGGATVESSEVAATTAAQAKIPFPIQKEIKAEQIKITAPKISFKKIIAIAISGVMAISILTGYKALQVQYTPKRTVERFYNYIVKEDYDNAYKMLVDTDDRFMTNDNFKAVMKQKNIKTFYIKNYNPNEFKQDYSSENPQNANLNGWGNMFTVQASSKLYPISVVENGKKLVFFKDYKINASNLSIKWQLTAPQGAKISINGKEPQISTESNLDNINIWDKYKPTTVLYETSRIFEGSYDITATMEGAEDVKVAAAPAGKKVTLKFVPNADTVKQLQDQAKSFLDLYYTRATEDKYSELLTTDSNALKKINSFGFFYGSDKVTNKVQDIKVTKQSIDDLTHAAITVKCTIYYEDSSMGQWGGITKTGTRDMETDFYFEKVNGRWLISDSGYIN